MPNIREIMRICVFILSMLLSQISFGQEFKLDSLFKVFQNDIKTLQAYNKGVVVWDDDTRECYYLLMKESPIDTLLKFLDNSNPAIRCFIFSGVVNKNADEKAIRGIVNNHLNDTASYKECSTDVVMKWTVNEYMQMTLKYKGDKKIDYEERLAKIRQYPRIILKGERHGVIRKNDLLKVDSLICNLENCKIISFTMTIQKDTNLFEQKSADNHITTAMKENINRLEIGDKLWIEDIKVDAIDGTIRNLGSKSLKIIQ